MASGATFILAAKWIKKQYKPYRVIAAATVASKESVQKLEEEIDEVEVNTKPQSSSFLGSSFVGQYYQHTKYVLIPSSKV